MVFEGNFYQYRRQDKIKKNGLLKVFYTNAYCLTKEKHHELEILARLDNIDIIAVTEIYSKICLHTTDYNIFYKIDGFNNFINGDEGRGVLMYIKQILKSCQINRDD